MNSPEVSIAPLLRSLVENHGSDLHLQVGEVPMGRIDGELGRFSVDPLTEDDVWSLIREIVGSDEKVAEFRRRRDMDTALSIAELGRFRVNLFFQRNQPGSVWRTIGTRILSIDDLGLPQILKNIATLPQGLILVTGATGSGKSTTLAAIIDHINATQNSHIMTLEDPIEFLHENKQCLVNQREMAADSEDFAAALKHVLRQDPDVILIGEMRDVESVNVALTAAETGHLVLATLHTSDAAESLDRIINMFPTDKIHQIRMQLAMGLVAIVCQKLIPKKGGGRAAALEILINSPRIRKLIMEGDTTKLQGAIQASRLDGMQTFNQGLAELVKEGVVEEQAALENSPKPDELRMNLKGIFSGTSAMG